MTRRLAWLPLLLLLASAAPSAACSIPVFRYALERWKPSAYEALVFHGRPLTGPGRDLIRRLERPAVPTNLDMTAVDLAGKVDPEHRALWARQGRAALPRLVLRYPESEAAAPDALSAPLT